MKNLLAVLAVLAMGTCAVAARAGTYYQLDQAASSATMKLAGVINVAAGASPTSPTITINGTGGVITATSFVGATTGNNAPATHPWADVTNPVYGAKGDGTTDDTNAIQAAMGAAADVFLPAGTYIVTTLTAQSNGRVHCAAGATLSLKTGGTDIIGGTVHDWEMEGCVLNGNWPANSSSNNGFSFNGADRVYIHDVKVTNVALKGFAFSAECNGVWLDHVLTNNTNQDGVALASDLLVNGNLCQNFSISHSSFTNGNAYGIGIDVPTTAYGRTKNISINDVYIAGWPLGYGISVAGVVGIQITDVRISSTGFHGITLGVVGSTSTVADKVLISGSIIKNFGHAGTYAGVQIQNANYVNVTGNAIFNEGEATPSGTYGVYYNAGSSNSVTGNSISVVGQACVANSATAQQLLLSNNIGCYNDQSPSGVSYVYGVQAATMNATSAITESGTLLSAKYAAVGGGNASGNWQLNNIFLNGAAGGGVTATYGVAAATGVFSGAVSAGSLSVAGSTLTAAASGVITAPSQPGARFYRGTSQATVNTNLGTTFFDTTEWSQGGLVVLATSSDTVTIPTTGAGIYSVICGCGWAANATGERTLYVNINGSLHAGYVNFNPGAGGVTDGVAADIIKLNAGDTVKCWNRQASGGSLNIGGNKDTFLALQKLW